MSSRGRWDEDLLIEARATIAAEMILERQRCMRHSNNVRRVAQQLAEEG